MDQQSFQLGPRVLPTGEASYRYEPQETDEGTYFALSYRRKRVCIDSGLDYVLSHYLRASADPVTLRRVDHDIAEFLADYPMLWWKNQHTGEFLELVRITSNIVDRHRLVLSPHYKVPNDQGMGRAPLHQL